MTFNDEDEDEDVLGTYDGEELTRDDEFMLLLLKDLSGILSLLAVLKHVEYAVPEKWRQTLDLFA